MLDSLETFFTESRIISIGKAVVAVLLGLLFARFLAGGIDRAMQNFSRDAQRRMVVDRVVFYSVVGLSIVVAVRQLGIDLSLFLGAAGVLTVAVGFAAQTSTANLISGFFLMAEKPFVVNDIIEIGDNMGEVIEIGLLSTSVRTFDNRMVRIPNESLMKSEFKNYTRFPIRRVDLKLRVGFTEDLDRLRDLLTQQADEEPLCLDEPRPLFLVLGFGESSLEIQFSVWCQTRNTVDVRNTMYDRITRCFERNAIKIPYPHRVVLMSEKIGDIV